MLCSRARSLAVEDPDRFLTPPEAEELAAHLRACGACRAEQDALRRAELALHLALPEGAPDLWAGFSARLAAEVPCAQFREKLYSLRDGAEPLLPGVALHRKHCPACDALATELDLALDQLEAFGAAVPAPDLWSAFSARLAAEQARRRGGLAGLWETAQASFAVNPAALVQRVAVGAAALLALAALPWIAVPRPESAPQDHRIAPDNAAIRNPTATRVALGGRAPGPAPRQVAAVAQHGRPVGAGETAAAHLAGIRSADARRSRPHRAIRVAAAGVRRRVVRPAPAGRLVSPPPQPSEQANRVWSDPGGKLDVALYVPRPEAAPRDSSPPAGWGETQGDVMPEAVEAIRLLAGVAEAAAAPFQPLESVP
ncbi:MAG: hypothetical protein FJ315_04235 [SAR202 cluster bacterium]|nr:hypothetical protein [SAR202 cluster bacterium]